MFSEIKEKEVFPEEMYHYDSYVREIISRAFLSQLSKKRSLKF